MQKRRSFQCGTEPGCRTGKNAGHHEAVVTEHFMLVPSGELSACNAPHVEQQQLELIVQTIGVSDPCPVPEHLHAE
jgi:hypothetical protein